MAFTRDHQTHSTIHKFGRCDDVDSGETLDVWMGGGSFTTPSDWTPPTAARLHSVKSTDATDDVGSTGALTLQIFGLDSDFDNQNETISLNGASDVATVNQYIRIHRMKVLTAGASDSNQGWITATAGTDNTITAIVAPSRNQTEQAIYTVPRNTVGVMSSFGGSVINTSGAASTEIQLWIRPFGQTWQLSNVMGLYSQGGGHSMHNMPIPMTIPPKADVKLKAYGSANNCQANGMFTITTPGIDTGEI